MLITRELGRSRRHASAHDGGRVGVVEHPAVGRVLLHVVDVLEHAGDGAHAVGDAARAAGLLAHDAVLQRNLLVEHAHGELTHADVRQAEVHVGVGRLGIGRGDELDRGILLMNEDLAGGGQLALALAIVVVHLDGAQRQTIEIVQQHEDNLGGVGAAAAGDDDGELLLVRHVTSFRSKNVLSGGKPAGRPITGRKPISSGGRGEPAPL